jgi:TfoX/Sxy family transcriptional regulator of competence genes
VAYDEDLASKIHEILAERVDVSERKMFGGIAFMAHGHMCCGVVNDDLVLRLGPERAEKMLTEPSVRPMDFTGRPIRGSVYVGKEGVRTEAELRKWVDTSLECVNTLRPK